MRALIQRISQARVVVDAETVGETGPGLLVLACAMGATTTRQLNISLARSRAFGSLRTMWEK